VLVFPTLRCALNIFHPSLHDDNADAMLKIPREKKRIAVQVE
jgi:hypothetical protein